MSLSPADEFVLPAAEPAAGASPLPRTARVRVALRLSLPYRALLVACGYALAGLMGHSLRFPPEGVAVLWPPNAVLIAGLLLSPRRRPDWAVLAAAAALAEVALDLAFAMPWQMSLALAVVDISESLVCAAIFLLIKPKRIDFGEIRQIVAFSVAAVAGPLLGGLLGGLIFHLAWGGSYYGAWRVWWFGNGVGTLIVAPALVTALNGAPGRRRPLTAARVVETLALSGGCILTLLVIYTQVLGMRTTPAMLSVMPFLLWAAVRFRPLAVSILLLFYAVISVWGTGEGYGPAYLLSDTPSGRILTLQGMLVFSAVSFQILAAVICTRDRQEAALRASRAELAFQVTHDFLTGLTGRREFARQLDLVASSADVAPGAGVAILYIDLDGFKTVNDQYGHMAGDEVLIVVANRLQLWSGPRTSVARLAGDQFGAVLQDVDSSAAAVEFARRLLAGLTKPVTVDGRIFQLGATIGVATSFAPVRGELLLREADAALTMGKRRGRNRVQHYDAALGHSIEARHGWEAALREAAAEGGFQLLYQPIFDLASCRPVGAEALLRLCHPVRGLVSAGEFITVAEESGLIVEIGRWVTRAAIRQAGRWTHLLGRTGFLTFNLSVRQLQAGGVGALVARELASVGVDPRQICVEITESAFADPSAVRDELAALRSLGVRFAIDDFGIGYSCLARLHEYPVDYLKIDKSLVTALGDDPGHRSSHLVSSVLDLATALNADVIVEGIEDGAQLARLQQLGAPLGQGFLLARPMPDHAIESLHGWPGPPTPGTVTSCPTAVVASEQDRPGVPRQSGTIGRVG